MHSATLLSTLLVAGFSSKANAKLGFGATAPTYNEGALPKIRYWMDSDYVGVHLELVHMFPDGSGWDTYDIMMQIVEEEAGNQTFIGYKMREGVPDHEYAFWLSALDKDLPSSGGKTTGYAALSDPFKIVNRSDDDDDDDHDHDEEHHHHHHQPVSHVKLAVAALSGFGLCALVGSVMTFFLRRRRASKKARVMVPAEYSDSCESVMHEKERVRLAMG